MHGKLKGRKFKKRASLWENGFLVLVGVLGFVTVATADSRGLPRKWHAAIFGTLLPFGFVIYANRRRLLRWSFLASLAICLGVHIAMIWVFFQYVLLKIQTFSIWLWFPVAFVEAWVLLIAVKRIEEKFTGQRETIKLSF
jgi:hypothetical protein